MRRAMVRVTKAGVRTEALWDASGVSEGVENAAQETFRNSTKALW